MPNIDIKKIKEKKKAHDQKVKAIKSEYERMNKKPEKVDLKTEVQQKVNTLEYYNALSESEKLSFRQELKLKKIRDNYLEYLKYVYGDNYIVTPFHELLAKLADNVVKRVEKGENIKVCISTPPSHGKSCCLSDTLPSWFLGRNPNGRAIVTAYNADIAQKMGDRNRQKIKTYGKELFGIEISDSQDNKTQWDIKGKMGGLYATGLLGSLTGNHGNLIIVDDPFKNEEEANNKVERDRVWSAFTSAILTRAKGNCGLIVIHTRWHEDDLIGRIIENDVDNEWIVLNIPCVWEKGYDKLLHRKVGETLCPQLGFDSKWANSIKKMLGNRVWSALYQGKPYCDNGEILNRSMIKTFSSKTMPPSFEEITLSCDLSFGRKKRENDPNGIGVWGRVGANHYLIKVINEKLTFTEALERIRYLCGTYTTMTRKIVEGKANGDAVVDTLNREIGGFVVYDPKMNSKEDRLRLCMPYFESGNVFLPDESVDKKSEEYIQQLVRFPRATHDEIVDITTQYLLNYQYRYGGKINTDNKYRALSQAIRGLKI